MQLDSGQLPHTIVKTIAIARFYQGLFKTTWLLPNHRTIKEGDVAFEQQESMEELIDVQLIVYREVLYAIGGHFKGGPSSGFKVMRNFLFNVQLP